MVLSCLSRWLIGMVIFLLLGSAVYAESPIVLTAQEQDFLRRHPVVTAQNEQKYPPYNFYDEGMERGLSIDYMNLLAEKLGIKVSYIRGYEWSGFMQLIKENKLDIMLNIMHTPQREEYLHFTEPYAATQKAIFTNNAALKKLSDLQGKRVCVPRGFFIEHFLEAYYPSLTLMREESLLACMKRVVSGKSDAVVGSDTIIRYLMRREHLPIAHEYAIEDKRLTVGLSIAVAPKLKILRDILQKAMYSVTEEELAALSSKWMGPQHSGIDRNYRHATVEPYAKKRIVTMCNNPDWAPIEFVKEGEKREAQGIAIDTLKILEKQLNIDFQSVPTRSWYESQQFLKEGKCEILPAATVTKKRKEFANFTTPYLSYKLAIITKNNKPFIDGLDEIAQKSVARKKGSGLIDKLKNRYPHMQIIETENHRESLKKVSNEEAYCTIATLPVVSHYINHFALHDLHISGYTDMRYRLSIAVTKSDTQLLKKLNAALSQISQQQQRAIYDKWVGQKLVESFDYRYLYYPAGAALLLLLLLSYRGKILKDANKNLQKEIEEKVRENLIQHQFIQEHAKFAALGEMIGVIAHQWRQPLNALGLSIQNLHYHYKDGMLNDTFIDQYIDKNLQTIKFMSETIDDFRGFFKMDKVKEYFSVKEAIEATFQMQSLYLEKHSISFDIRGDDFEVYGLRSEFQQVILNLISNAKDALIAHREEKRGIEVYLEDRVIVFMDNGGGISEEIIDKVFHSYFTTKEEGMGIGLSISKIIIEKKMGGLLTAYSQGKGTVIVIDFKEGQEDESI